MEGEDSGEKQFEPTQKKLDDARKKGEVPRSVDLNTAAGYGGILLIAVTFGSVLLQSFSTKLQILFDRAPELSADIFSGAIRANFSGLGLAIVTNLLPWFLGPMAVVIGSIIVQQSFVVAPSKLQPKISRISPISNAKNKYGRSGLFEFAKSFVKLTVFCVVLGIFLVSRSDQIVGAVHLPPKAAVVSLLRLGMDFLVIVLVVAISIGAIDILWQRAEHIRKNRMSRKDLTDEAKQSEGDPHIKQQRLQKAQEIAHNQMLADIPGADVTIVNPTHYAVTLRWERAPGHAPKCVAKGVDEVAAKIREISTASGVPIHRDKMTARELYANVKIGEQIAPEHYRAVAAAIRFADTLRSKAKSQTGALS